ncbi:MAG: hypothetical protein LBJ89_04570 [Holosporales bacterium]|jgi:hypothetical protein|nr:hypothetical protein [Holosporales bacterium]
MNKICIAIATPFICGLSWGGDSPSAGGANTTSEARSFEALPQITLKRRAQDHAGYTPNKPDFKKKWHARDDSAAQRKLPSDLKWYVDYLNETLGWVNFAIKDFRFESIYWGNHSFRPAVYLEWMCELSQLYDDVLYGSDIPDQILQTPAFAPIAELRAKTIDATRGLVTYCRSYFSSVGSFADQNPALFAESASEVLRQMENIRNLLSTAISNCVLG